MCRLVLSACLVIALLAISGPTLGDTYANSLANGYPWTDGVHSWGMSADCYPDNGSAACGDGRWFVTLDASPNLNTSVTLTGLTCGPVTGGLAGTGSITITEQLNWMGGLASLGGNSFTLMPGCISTIGAMTNGTTLTNQGDLLQTGVIRNGATIINAVGAEWEVNLPADSYFLWDSANTFINHGVMRKTGPASVYCLGTALFHITETGQLIVEGGEFRFAGGLGDGSLYQLLDGDLEVMAGATATFSQVVTTGPAARVEGAGTFRIQPGNVNMTVNGTWDVSGLTEIRNGNLAFDTPCVTNNYSQCNGTVTGDVTVSGLANFNGGTMAAPGTTWINGDMIIDGALACGGAQRFIDGRAVNLAAGSELEILGGGPSGSNGATLNLPSGCLTTINTPPDFRIMNGTAGGATIDNDGTIIKTNTGEMHLGWLLNNRGLIDIQQGRLYFNTNGLVQTAGETRLWPGVRLSSVTAIPIEIDGGSLTGDGIIGSGVATDVNCDGRLAPGSFGSDGAGRLSVSGDVVLGASAMTDMDLGGTTAGTDHDQVAITPTLTLGGELRLSMINGFENSAMAGDVLVLLTAASHIPSVSGAFTNVASGADLETADGKGVFTIWYGAGSPHGNYRVVATNFRPLCPADINGDGVVSVTDLLSQLAAWGPCPGGPCPADITGDGQVNVSDLLDLLANWGPCP
jgi:hypothetical protein